jgi:GT2 family glycosyltransferase
MDDDCVASATALERLLAPQLGACIKNSVSVSNRNPSELAFYVDRPNKSYRKVADFAGIDLIFGVAALFNGTLISADVVRDIGVPDRRLFIWGDEVEYMTRALMRGYAVVTVTDSVFSHPPAVDRDGIPWPGAWKQYYAIRNQRRVFQNLHGTRYGFLVYWRWALRVTTRQLRGKGPHLLYNFLLHLEAGFDSTFNRFGKRPENIRTLQLYRFLHGPGGIRTPAAKAH